MQRASFTDHTGQFWHPDDYYMNGHFSISAKRLKDRSTGVIFYRALWTLLIRHSVDTRDRYTLILHFVEFYFGGQTAAALEAVCFRVMCNGGTCWIISTSTRGRKPACAHQDFLPREAIAQGKLNITFEPIENNATVRASRFWTNRK